MPLSRLLIPVLLVSLASSCGSREEARSLDPFSNIRGAYLGQRPPGTTPQPFAPGLISTEKDEGGMTVSPGGTEIFFWTVEAIEGGGGARAVIYVTEERDGAWTSPEAVSFSGEYSDGYASLHPDGSRLFFQSDRPIDSSESEYEYNIWYVDREGDGWSEAKSIGRPINGRNHTGGASATLDGTLYFTLMDLESGSSELFRSEYVNGAYQEPVRLPDGVNSHYQTTDSCVDPDDRYLVFTAFERQGHVDNPGYLYVAFHDEDGTWSDAVRLGTTMNSEDRFGSVTISPDGRYLFFTRINEPSSETNVMGLDLYWIDSAVVDDKSDTG